MSPTVMRKKVIEYVNHAEDNVLELVYKMLQIYSDDEAKSAMTMPQKQEIEKRAASYKKGLLKTNSWEDVKKSARK